MKVFGKSGGWGGGGEWTSYVHRPLGHESVWQIWGVGGGGNGRLTSIDRWAMKVFGKSGGWGGEWTSYVHRPLGHERVWQIGGGGGGGMNLLRHRPKSFDGS